METNRYYLIEMMTRNGARRLVRVAASSASAALTAAMGAGALYASIIY